MNVRRANAVRAAEELDRAFLALSAARTCASAGRVYSGDVLAPLLKETARLRDNLNEDIARGLFGRAS